MSELEKTKLNEIITDLNKIQNRRRRMISLIIPSGYNITTLNETINNQINHISRIKFNTLRLEMLSDMRYIQQKLKLYNKIPNNGLIIYYGNRGNERTDTEFEPYKPITNYIFMYDYIFHTDVLKELL